MIIEKIIFSLLAFYLFILMFFKMIKKMDITYVVVVISQAIGIALRFIEIIFSLQFNIFLKILIYLISIVVPLIIIYIEKKGKNFSEIAYIWLAKFYSSIRKYKKM